MKISIFEQFSVLLLVIIMEVPFLEVKIILETKTMIYSLFFRCHKKRNGCKGNEITILTVNMFQSYVVVDENRSIFR